MDSTAVQPQPRTGPTPEFGRRTDIGRLLRLRVPLIVKLAERRMRLGEVLRFSPGAIIEFSKPAEEPLDVMVNNVVIGQGDVVKVGENFGVRVTRIDPPHATIRALGGETPSPDQ